MKELQKLTTIINGSATSIIGSTSVANSGIKTLISSFHLNSQGHPWILDSGATDHMTLTNKFFKSYEPIAPGKHVQTADGTLLPVAGLGTMEIPPIGLITHVLHVPKLFVNLISVQKLAKLTEYQIIFDDIDAYLFHKVQKSRIGLARIQHGLYYLLGANPALGLTAGSKAASAEALPKTLMEVHQRMGHPSFHLLKQMYPHEFKNIDVNSILCESCQLGKFKRASYPAYNHRLHVPLQLLHCDVWGPSPQTDLLGHRYFLICTDDHSRFTWLFLLKTKSEVTSCLKNLCVLIEQQFGQAVKGLRTDNAKDFLNNALSEFLASKGIVHETSCPYTPQQNGLAERKIGVIVDKARTLLIQANLPLNLWGFSVMTAVHLLNRLPSRTLQFQSPISLLEKYFPNTRLKTGLPVKIFGCVAYVHNPAHKTNKWSAKAFKCVFLGYSSTQKGYKLYHPITRKYLVSKDVIFDESVYYYKSTPSDSLKDLGYLKLLEETPVPEHDPPSPLQAHRIPSSEEPSCSQAPQVPLPDTSIPVSASTPAADDPPLVSSSDIPEPDHPPLPKYYKRKPRDGLVESVEGEVLGDWSIALRKGKRSCVKPRIYDISNFLTFTQVSPQYKTFLVGLQDINIPKSRREGLRISLWKEAMDEEMRALIHNDTWDIVDLPKGKKPVGCRWIFTLKYNADGTLDRHKARLVARGYTQTYGIDYQETFAPVAKLNTIRIMISLAVNLDWPLLQYDIKNAFLNGELKEEIYMDIPPGYEDPTATGKVCKLKKALYGLKQSPRAWFCRFSQKMKSLGYKQCNGEHTLFSKHSSPVLLTILVVYVDDIIILLEVINRK